MGTEIKIWQIVNGKLTPIDMALRETGRTEPYDLEPWLVTNPQILGPDMAIIGRQVATRSGPIDLLAIDNTGNLVIVELKRDQLPREALAQGIDYASNVAEWGIEKVSEVCTDYTGKTLMDFFAEIFPDFDIESLTVNETQRILLVGFSVESSLERMIEWLTDHYDVNINAVVLNYVKTSSGDELLARTSIISEESEQERVKKQKKFEIPMSDEPGSHEAKELKERLVNYLSVPRVTNQRIRDVLLPACLGNKIVTREQLKRELGAVDASIDPSKLGIHLATISVQLGMKKNDFLRQVLSYEYPTHHWEKDNFAVRPEYRTLATEVLEHLKHLRDT